ncbi:MAG: roadblock/LC7 domain-containing protein [Candidatus Helarchaeota archaeon]
MEQQILTILKKISTRVKSVVLVDKNGLPLQSLDTKTKKPIDPSIEMNLAGIAAAVLSLAESTSSVIDHGNLKELIIKKEKGALIILDAGKSTLLLGIVPPKLGFDTALTSLKIAASKIAKLEILSPSPLPKPGKSGITIPDID